MQVQQKDQSQKQGMQSMLDLSKAMLRCNLLKPGNLHQDPLQFLGIRSARWTMGRAMKDECKLDYYEPSMDNAGNPICTIPKSEILNNIEKWRNTLIGYVLGDKQYMHLKACTGRS